MKKTNKKLRVGILGATGMVGQKFIALLENHPWFEIEALGASSESAGKSYRAAVFGRWKNDRDIPELIAKTKIVSCEPRAMKDIDFVLSGLDSAVAGTIEKSFAEYGIPVISNSKNYRLDEDVPLVVPEVNPDHTRLIEIQMKKRQWKGFIVTNPNCVVVPLVMALKPIVERAGLRSVAVVSMQAISGAGYPGVASLDILDNVIPYIIGEEPKVEVEPLKILGSLRGTKVHFLKCPISAQCNRVAVRDGHLLNIYFSTRQRTSTSQIKTWLKNFRGEPQRLKLPSAPTRPVVYLEDDFRPQPLLDRNRDKGMSVSVGRLRNCPAFGFKMVVLGHNTIRGAAGTAILNAELLYKQGYLLSSKNEK